MARRSLARALMDAFLQDLRYGCRALLRAPFLALTATVTIGLGAGANATVFSFVDALLFRPAPGVADASSLVAVHTSDFSSGPYGSSSHPDFLSLKEEATALRSLAAQGGGPGTIVTFGSNTERISTAAVTANFFDVLGLQPAIGRLFIPSDEAPGAPPAAVIGHTLWSRVFGENPTAVGSIVAFGARAFTIVGVTAPGFTGLDLGTNREVWTVLQTRGSDPAERGNRGLAIVGRLSEGATVETAQAQLATIADRLARDYPETNLGTLQQPDRPRPFTVVPHTRIGARFRGQVTMLSAVIMTAAVLVLLVGCANVGSLLLARATARGREIAIRTAIGANRVRIVRQLIAESALLGIAGGVAGLLFALWTADVLPSFFPAEQARLLDARVDLRVLGFCLTVATAASLLFGLAPALQSLRPAMADMLRGNTISAGDSRLGSRFRRAFVVGQVALAFTLLIGAGLLVRSLHNALNADLGFGTREAAVVSLELSRDVSPALGQSFYTQALERVNALPGVRQAALATAVPLTGRSRRGFRVEGYQPRPGEDMELPVSTVTPNYFDTMRIPLKAGRVFDRRDAEGGARVVVVNEVVANRYFGGDAVGGVVASGRNFEIVGVVGATAYLEPQSGPTPFVYFPLAQDYSSRIMLVAATDGDAASQIEPIVNNLRELNRSAAVFRPTTLKGHVDEALAADRITASLVSVCGILALLLATVGVYGVVAYFVALRKREIGVRIALGASPRHVSRLVLKEGLVLTVGGVLLGGILSPVATTALGSMLYRVSPLDPRTFVTVPLIFAATAVVAALIPVRRALRIDPIDVLRQE